MDELRDLLQSAELNKVVEAIEALRSKYAVAGSHRDRKSFETLALGSKFRASEIVEILLDGEPSYPGLKEVLAAGFVGWVIFPKAKEVRMNLMLHAAMDHMNTAEMNAGVGGEPLDLKRDVIARYLFTGTEFLTEIYDKFGGYEAFTRTINLELAASLFDDEKRTIHTTVSALSYLHLGADRFRDAEYDFAPSLNRAVTIFEELKEPAIKFPFKQRYVSRSLLHKRWSATKPSLALIYAASTVRVGRKTLLDVLLDGLFNYPIHGRYLPLWLSRARYVGEHVFRRMTDPQLYSATIQLLKNVPPQAFPVPKLEEVERRIAESAFRRKFRNLSSLPLEK